MMKLKARKLVRFHLEKHCNVILSINVGDLVMKACTMYTQELAIIPIVSMYLAREAIFTNVQDL